MSVIALGAGAFFTGFLTYVVGRKELKSIINLAVIIGFICYSGAVAMLGIDIGQPIRGWFIFWHANIHSMLTEVSFCITCYLMVLTIEFLPNILENERLNKIPEIHFLRSQPSRNHVRLCQRGYVSVLLPPGFPGRHVSVSCSAAPYAYRPEMVHLAHHLLPVHSVGHVQWTVPDHSDHQSA